MKTIVQSPPVTIAWSARLVRVVLGEPFLGFLAIMSAALTLSPMLFKVSPGAGAILELCQWSIIALFAVEYGAALRSAPDKRAFVLSPWRVIDLITILVPLATLLPGVSDLFRSSPVLRLVRLARVVTMGVRATGAIVRTETQKASVYASGPVEISVLRQAQSAGPSPASWQEFVKWARSPGQAWYHLSNVSPDRLTDVAAAAGFSPALIESHFLSTGYPRLDVSAGSAALFVWLPEPLAASSSQRAGVLLLATEHAVFTLTRRSTNLLAAVAPTLSKISVEALPFPVRIIYAFLQMVVARNEDLVGAFEEELRELEEVSVRESRPPFFEQAFRLKKELSTVQSDLWRLKGMLTRLAEARVKLPGSGGAEIEYFRDLGESVDYLYETTVNTREGVLSIIDLHLNVVSFEMNRVMRVLAVVSVLGLVPAVVGGLLGMNLADNPWPFTLPQVAFGVSLGMILCLYLFLVKGWLR
jgi:Mg2+ and Co2+ transporter CorA